MFGLWCNGSTTGFGSVCPSSNLGSPTKKSPERDIFRGFFFRDSEVVVFVYPYKIEVYRGSAYIKFINLILFVILTILMLIVLVVE